MRFPDALLEDLPKIGLCGRLLTFNTIVIDGTQLAKKEV